MKNSEKKWKTRETWALDGSSATVSQFVILFLPNCEIFSFTNEIHDPNISHRKDMQRKKIKWCLFGTTYISHYLKVQLPK